jgi:NAD(P)-dependent dehydrogenase (short-subunit alcohol dehydrogenase family)
MTRRRVAAGGGHREVEGSVLVTGASSGIGEATTLHLASLGYRVFPTVRRDADARRLGERARDELGSDERVAPVLLDVTLQKTVDSAAAAVEEQVRRDPVGLIGIISNAGVGMMVPVEHAERDLLRSQLETNLVGSIAVVRAFLPLLRSSLVRASSPRRGRIYFVGTGGGVGAPVYPLLGPYMATKWGLEAICQSLRLEMQLRDEPIDVGMINPGFIDTPMRRTTQAAVERVFQRMPSSAQQSYGALMRKFGAFGDAQRATEPIEVARAVAEAIASDAPRSRYLVGPDSKRGAWVKFLPTRVREFWIRRVFR